MPRRRLHRLVFLAAGLYNIGWGIFSALDPQWLFRWSGMPPLNHPSIFACLAMVIGLYGFLYLEVAEILEQVLPEDLIRYGLIPEFVGRLPVVATLEQLDEEAASAPRHCKASTRRSSWRTRRERWCGWRGSEGMDWHECAEDRSSSGRPRDSVSRALRAQPRSSSGRA